MDPVAKLKELEAKIVEASLVKLEKLIERGSKKDFLAGCPIHHNGELVKLAHQIRSLLGV